MIPRPPFPILAVMAGFRALMRLMPRSFDTAQRDEAIALMERLAREAHVRHGAVGVVAIAIPALADLVWRMAMESLRSSRSHRLPPRPPRLDRWAIALENLQRDVRDGLRSIVRRPVHSAAIVSTLALGIGLNAAVFSVVDWVLLRPLPYPSPEELVRLWVGDARVSGAALVSYSQVSRVTGVPAVRAATGFSVVTRIASGDQFEPVHMTIARLTGDLFGTLGTRPRLGRPFDVAEQSSGQPVAVVSDSVWRNRFASDPAIVGRVITIDNVPHTIVGVMPAGRGYPRDAEIWRPATAAEREDDDRENVLIARLFGEPSDAVKSQLAAAILSESAEVGGELRAVMVESLQNTEVRNVRPALLSIFGAAILVLLVACANVASLLGTRGAERAGEWAVRGALGARSGQLVRQLAVECGLLAAAGGALGLLLGSWTLQLIVALAPAAMPRLDEVAIDGRVTGLGAALLLLVGGAVTLTPARNASSVDLRGALVGISLRATSRSGGRRLLVGAQVAMAVILTVGAGLLTRSLQKLVAVDHGFNPDGVIAVSLNMRGVGPDESRAMFHRMVDAATTVPSVRSAAVAFRLPTEIGGLRVSTQVQGLSLTPFQAGLRLVTPAYFQTVGLPLLEGRALSDADARQAPKVAVVNRAFARAALDGAPAIDQVLTTDITDDRIAIVGVVADVTPAGEADRPAIYMSFAQLSINAGSLLVRVDGNPSAVVPLLVARLRSAAPGLPLDRIRTLDETLSAGRAVARFNTIMASSFGVLAVALAVIGVYGLVAVEAASRRREAGVRLALGATRGEVLWSVLAPIGRTMMVAIVAGVAGAVGLATSMRAMLAGITPSDPVALLVLPALLAVAGVLAALAAAWPLCRTDPATTLRI